MPSWLIRVLIFQVLPTTEVMQTHPGYCVFSGWTLTCQGIIPDEVPNATECVHIRKYGEIAIPEQSFTANSWRNVTKLDVEVRRWPFVVAPGDFRLLIRLTYLGIHAYDVNLTQNSFSGLEQLRELNMSSCGKLTSSHLFQALLQDADKLQNLDYLNLNYLNSHNARVVHFNDMFASAIEALPIKSLSVTGTNLLFSINDLSKFNQSLRNWSVRSLDLSNVTLQSVSTSNGMFVSALFINPNLDLLIINGMSIGLPNDIIEQKKHIFYDRADCLENNVPLTLIRLKKFYANKVLGGSNNVITYYTVNLSLCDRSSLQILHLRENGLSKLNLTLIFPDNSLKELDLAFNSLQYVSPKFIQNFTVLETIVFRGNNLNKMEHLPEFEQLFNKQTKLEHFDMSRNKLSYIPYEFFAYNTQLKVIDLSENKLSSITFSYANLTMLLRLNLHSNMILLIDHEHLLAIKTLFLRNESTIELDNNPLQCSCANLEFLQWVVNHPTPRTRHLVKCYLDENILEIDQTAIDEAKETCSRFIVPPTFWISLVVFIAVVVITIVLFARHLKDENVKLRNEKRKKEFVQQYKQGAVREKHIVFLSENIDTDDEGEGLVFIQVLEGFGRVLLQQMEIRDVEVVRCYNVGPTRTNVTASDNFNVIASDNFNSTNVTASGNYNVGPTRTNVIASDNFNGRIGFYRDEAADNFIKHSCVVVIILSVTEPDNRYFKTDLELAKAYNKPVCLLARPSSKRVGRYLTVDLVERTGGWQPQLGWEMFCEQILTMAANQYHEKQSCNINGAFTLEQERTASLSSLPPSDLH